MLENLLRQVSFYRLLVPSTKYKNHCLKRTTYINCMEIRSNLGFILHSSQLIYFIVYKIFVIFIWSFLFVVNLALGFTQEEKV